MKKILLPASIIVIIGSVVFSVFGIKSALVHPSAKLNYPYVCKDCGAAFDVQDLKGKFQSPKGAPTDTVATCIKCNKGWAFPVGKCDQCGTEHILHITPDSRCPKCFPEAAAAAKKAGVDTVFKRPG